MFLDTVPIKSTHTTNSFTLVALSEDLRGSQGLGHPMVRTEPSHLAGCFHFCTSSRSPPLLVPFSVAKSSPLLISQGILRSIFSCLNNLSCMIVWTMNSDTNSSESAKLHRLVTESSTKLPSLQTRAISSRCPGHSLMTSWLQVQGFPLPP